MNSERQGLQSTKLHSTNTSNSALDLDDYFPSSDSPNVKTKSVCYALVNLEEISTAYIDLTGRFPKKSLRGNEYILVGYHYDGNCILGEPIKDRQGPTITEAWKKLYDMFKLAGASPETYVMDNETSKDLLSAFQDERIDYQLVTPYKHRNNKAERAIRIFKSHFKSCLATTDPKFPLAEWDRLIPQANITLNLLRSSRCNPKLSAYSYIFGTFNFRATPMAPPGTKVVAHVHPSKRGSWDLNAEVGWYVGPSMKHYRCVDCYFPRSRMSRHCDTVEFIPHDIPFPSVKLKDYLIQSADDIISLLTYPPSNTTPSLQEGDPVRNALLELATQLKRIEKLPETHNPQQHDALSPRVQKHTSIPSPSTQSIPHTIPYDEDEAPSPRVQNKSQLDDITIQNLTTLSNLPKNARFRNSPTHSYRLRSTTAPNLIAQHACSNEHHLNQLYTPSGKKETIDSLLKGDNSAIWERSLSNEWGRLAQGNNLGVKGTNTISFISKSEVPTDKKVTYASFVCDYRPLKQEAYRVRITVGGDKLPYEEDAGAPAANLLETKILLNSVISDAAKGARFMSADIKDHFLATPMHDPEYMRVPYKHFPADIRQRYNLDTIVHDNYIYIRIQKGMPGLKQAALLAYEHLKSSLAPYSYYPIPGTIGLWKHKTRRTIFCLCVDDFGIKYWSKEDADHLCNAIGANFRFTVDWEGTNYCGLSLDWNYSLEYVDISMPKYIPAVLKKLLYVPKVSPQYSPHRHSLIQYGKQQQIAFIDLSKHLPEKEIKRIQQIVGSFLYYARGLDYTLLPSVNDASITQAKPTELTKLDCQQILDYAATYDNVYVRFKASDMVLHVDSDAAYLVLPNAKSRVAGYFYLSDHPDKDISPTLNGAILVECKGIKHVLSSSAEAETAGLFHNAQIAIPIRYILDSIGHVQPATPLKTDNSTAHGFVHNNIHQKRSKSWDMRYHWLREKQTKDVFRIFWDKGSNNHADYFTKHHPAKHHLEVRRTLQYVRDRIKS